MKNPKLCPDQIIENPPCTNLEEEGQSP